MTMWDQVSDAERERLVADLVGALPDSEIPPHLRAALVRYFVDGILPGGFLQAVLCADLPQAMARHSGLGSAHAEYTIGKIYGFLLDHAPFDAWGSRAKVLAWTTTPDRLEIEP
jgi:hypothetical protein